MDRVIAERMEKELSGTLLGGWLLAESIGRGKSALVFRASKGSQAAAVKVFDRELVERFGKEVQLKRIERECSLIGSTHSHLIEILDGGEDAKRDLLYVSMSLFQGKNLAEALPNIPHEKVSDIITQVASAARFLETRGLAHRDIKPENIAVSDDHSRAVLLDLGVLRPFGLSTITDQYGQKVFVGTLQYSAPELLHRTEEDTEEGWRAVTFYQLGAVLHDLLTRTPIFANDLEPYAHLVDVVSHKSVTIAAPGTPSQLRLLAQNCLVKDPHTRLALVSWDDFAKRSVASNDLLVVRERVDRRRARSIALAPSPALPPGVVAKRATESLLSDIERAARDGCKGLELPPFRIQTEETACAIVDVLFGPSRTHSTTGSLAVRFEGVVTDVGADSITVEARAAASTDASLLAAHDWATMPSTPVFCGVRTTDVLAQRIEQTLLIAFDRYQDLGEQGLIDTAVVNASGVAND